MKTFSNWPTYPQMYKNGELIGGLDVMKVQFSKLFLQFFCKLNFQEMAENGELADLMNDE